jgi:hypothetical protein
MTLKKLPDANAFQRLAWLELRGAEPPRREARRAARIGIDAAAYLAIIMIFVLLWVATP